MIIKIAFDPAKLKRGDEAYPAFKAGGIVLKFWALYKKTFITSQHFRESLVLFAELIGRMHDIDDCEVKPYMNIDEFMGYLGSCNFYGSVGGPFRSAMAEWVVRYWDYFNLSIQRQIQLSYKVVKEVDETMTIKGLGWPKGDDHE
jgi:hypothetical protein